MQLFPQTFPTTEGQVRGRKLGLQHGNWLSRTLASTEMHPHQTWAWTVTSSCWSPPAVGTCCRTSKRGGSHCSADCGAMRARELGSLGQLDAHPIHLTRDLAVIPHTLNAVCRPTSLHKLHRTNRRGQGTFSVFLHRRDDAHCSPPPPRTCPPRT